MLNLALQTAVDVPTQLEPATTADTVRTVGDVGITLAAVKVVGALGRRGIMAHFLPDDGVDASAAEVKRDPYAMGIMALAYAVGVALTTAAVYLVASLPYALAWAGAWAFVAAVVALGAARNATPLDDVRLLAVAKRGEREA